MTLRGPLYTNPRDIREVRDFTKSSHPPTIPPPVSPPFINRDWPVLAVPSRIDATWIEVGNCTLPFTTTRILRQLDWPVPTSNYRPDATYIQFKVPPNVIPLRQQDWPLPVQPVRPDFTWVEFGNALPPLPTVNLPKNQYDWPLPTPQPYPAWLYTYTDGPPTPGSIPPPVMGRNQYDWPLPTPPSKLDIWNWIDEGNNFPPIPNLNFPKNQYDWPNPTPQPYPAWLYTAIDGPPTPGSIPPPVMGKNQYYWPLPVPYYRPDGTWINTGAALLPSPLPKNQYDWPLPGSPPRPDETWTYWFLPSHAKPFNQLDWPLPGRYPVPDGTWINVTPFIPPLQFPHNQYDWPLPGSNPRPDEFYVFFNPNTQGFILVPLPLIKQVTDLTPPLPYRIDGTWINQVPLLTPPPPPPLQPQGGGKYHSQWIKDYERLVQQQRVEKADVKEAAAVLSRAGGLARAKALSPKQRSAIATLAANTRWKR